MKSKKSRTEKIINIVLNFFIVLFGIVLLAMAYCNVQTKLLGKDYADFFGYSMFEVQTGSMSDKINVGDWIVVKSSKNYEVSDIITYKYNNEYITHRIVESYNNTYVTKGDANNAKDLPINKDQVVGKVVKIFASLGILKKTMLNPAVLFAIIITILIFNFAFKNNDSKNIKEKLKGSIKISLPKILKKEKNKMKNIKDDKGIAKIIEPFETTTSEDISNQIETVTENEISSYVPVDISEIDDTLLEIAETDIKENIDFDPVKGIKIEPEEYEKPKPTKINLELLEGNKAKKSKNPIDKVMLIKIDELTEMINVLDDDGKVFTNDQTIIKTFISTYIDARYYNYFGDNVEATSKKISINVEKALKNRADIMIKKYKGSDTKYSDKVNRFLGMFVLISKLDEGKYLIEDNKAKNEFFRKEITKYCKGKKWNSQKIKNVILQIEKAQRNYVGILEYLHKKLQSNIFSILIDKLSEKNMFSASLDHSIEFSKVYSDYIIDKTYNEGVIAEDKLIVLLTLLSIKMIQDMINNTFNKKYLFYVPSTLYSKEKKLERILKVINDEHAKESAVILVTYVTFIKNKVEIKKLRKLGYIFAIVFDRESKIDEKNTKDLYLVNYIFVDKKVANIVKMISKLPDDIAEKIIYEDIVNKIGDFGGEQ